jgi:GDP-L-fucose synthase|tara:strand:+ start:18 stop:1001 length:984 start_codon:yes stop_codon:yes gene_type:complete
MIKKTKIYVAGHRGMVGSAIVRKLKSLGYNNILTRSHDELDLTNQTQVQNFFAAEKPDQVYLCAAKVGGIHANNTFPAEFIYDNLMIESNVIHNAWKAGVKKLLFLGSSCIYPKLPDQIIKENAMLSGQVESTNEPYAVAKIAGIKLCESYNRQYRQSHGTDYRSVIPTSLYGPGDNYHSENSHVIPALIRKIHDAKIHQLPEVVVWGSGRPRREFVYIDDMSAAIIHVMNLDLAQYREHTEDMVSHINIGFGDDVAIKELAKKLVKIVGYKGKIIFDLNKPDGVLRKLMDSSLIESLGWRATVSLEDGLTLTYADYLKNKSLLRSD